jgi:hypothetical protein
VRENESQSEKERGNEREVKIEKGGREKRNRGREKKIDDFLVWMSKMFVVESAFKVEYK